MKKTLRTVIIATAITIIIMLSCAYAIPAGAEKANRGEFYPKLSIVIKTEQLGELWLVSYKDKEGNIWAFYDDEGTWQIGDIANLLMWDLGEREKDDEIIEVYWEGYTENIEGFFHITNSRP